ncbi:S41 family peptidase [Telluria sp. Tellsp104]
MRRYMAAVVVLLSACAAHAESPSGTERTTLIASVIDQLQASYIDVEQANKLAPILRHADFSQAVDDEAFAGAVTALMQGVTKDQHLRLLYRAKQFQSRGSGVPASTEIAEWQAGWKRDNYGIERVERLPGNIGYFKINYFWDAAGAAPSIAAAMTLLAYTDALIIDLRDNGGGDADEVPLIASYLFDERTHLSDFYRREGNITEQQWTYPAVAGIRYGKAKEVYVLTSKATFSAGEGLAYALKNLKRATIVGETTRGGAHPSRMRRLNDHYEMMVPASTVRDHVTGKDWEGVGVLPDVSVPAEEALTMAQVMILKKRLADKPNAENRDEIRKRLAALGPGR